ncbi:MAG TPA: sulfotransferase [Actinomycetota bacterium]|nr:sulfotransferase [Actinomycetota bacterium]
MSDNSYDIRQTIVVCGSARSGTTWLAQTLQSVPGSAVLFEPLNLRRVARARRCGFRPRTYVRPGTDWPEGELLLGDILRGRLLTPWTVQEIRRFARVQTWIVKFIEANRMLPWLTERFPVRAPVLLVRHPCAVVASQVAAAWTGDVELHDADLETDFPAVKHVLDAVETPIEHRAARWAIDTLVPLSAPGPQRWTTLFYEDLVRNEETLDPLFDRWNIPKPLAVGAHLRKISSTADRRGTGHDPLTDWTRRLATDEVRRVLDVTHALGLDFYGEDPEPDRTRLRLMP